MEEKLRTAIKKITKQNPILERPINEAHGDWSTNIAMILAGKEKMNPKEIAEKIAEELRAELKNAPIESIEVAGQGFINFKIAPEYFLDNLENIDTTYGQQALSNPLRIMVEFGDPNTHKLPHIGHLFSYITGDSFARILKANGHTIFKANYQGDIGPHVAKSIYGWIEKGKKEPKTLAEKAKHLQECYQYGADAYIRDKNAKQKIDQINKDSYDPSSDIRPIWEKTRQWSVDYYETFEQLLGIKQKKHYYESQVWELGLKLVKEHVGKTFEKSKGAIIFPGEKFGLHSRVFITKNNTPTYEAKDMGLIWQKMQDWPFDLGLITTASAQNEYFKVVIAAIEQAFPEMKNKLKHIGFGMVSLSTGKMSSRTGNILSGQDLIETVEQRVQTIIKEKKDLSENQKQEIARVVSIGAIKYAFLKSNILHNMTFDLEESISFEGNSGPYLQYTYARIKSVLKQKVSAPKTDTKQLQLLKTKQELDIIKWLERYPETVKSAGDNFSPHLIAIYLFELAQRFNSFYRDFSINSAENQELIAARRFLSDKVAIVIKSGLELLGIETVETM